MNTTKNNQMSIASKIGFPIVMVAFVAMSSGCMTTFSTSSYEASPKPDSDIRQTHFMVESVTFYDHGDGKTIKDALRKLESGQNKSLIPVPYSVTVSAKSEHIDQGPVNGFLGVISLTVWPLWDGTRTIYGIRTKVLEDSIFAKGTESDTTVYGWLMLPTGVLGSLLLRDHIDFRSGSFEERIAKAAFGTLTKNRYDSAISGMTSAAKKRLKEGAPLSSTDERLLAMFPDPTLAMARAKHPGDLAKSMEALRSISDTKSLVDIAVHARIPEIRVSAAMKVTGLSESEFAELVRSCDDPFVEEVFLDHVSSSDMLAEIVGCEKVDESVRQKALDKISSPAVLAGIAKSADSAMAAAKEAAVAKLFVAQEEESLYDIALNAADKSIRESAFSKIETPSFIKRMATESKDVSMRLAALERIDDPEAVKEVAKTDENEDVRIAALSRVSDQTFLKEVVDSDSSPKVHAAAIAKITDEATLCEIAKSDADENIRRSVLDRIYDKPTILSMAENDPEASIRLAAIERMSGWSGPIFSDGKNQNEEQAVFSRIALSDSYASVRAAAIRLVKDEHVLVRVAKTDADPANRTFAVSHISDSEILQNEEGIRKMKERLEEAEKRRREDATRKAVSKKAEAERSVRSDIDHGKVQLWEGGPYWAETNIGAEKPEDSGLYFWWGDTVGYRREGDSWVASDGSLRNFSFCKNNTPTYDKDDETLRREGWTTWGNVLLLAHDAAHVHWGGNWRLPTEREIDDLEDYCDWTWTTMNGVNGCLIKGRGGYSSSSIFLPAAGDGEKTSLNKNNGWGYYWSSTFNFCGVYVLHFFDGGYQAENYNRHIGRSIRPVQGFAE